MKRLLSCEFNFDTVCVELKFSDGAMIAIESEKINRGALMRRLGHRSFTAEELKALWSERNALTNDGAA